MFCRLTPATRPSTHVSLAYRAAHGVAPAQIRRDGAETITQCNIYSQAASIPYQCSQPLLILHVSTSLHIVPYISMRSRANSRKTSSILLGKAASLRAYHSGNGSLCLQIRASPGRFHWQGYQAVHWSIVFDARGFCTCQTGVCGPALQKEAQDTAMMQLAWLPSESRD